VTAEAALLERLAPLDARTETIVRETEMLRVLDQHRGRAAGRGGRGLPVPGHELTTSRKSWARSTNELTRLTDERRKAIRRPGAR